MPHVCQDEQFQPFKEKYSGLDLRAEQQKNSAKPPNAFHLQWKPRSSAIKVRDDVMKASVLSDSIISLNEEDAILQF